MSVCQRDYPKSSRGREASLECGKFPFAALRHVAGGVVGGEGIRLANWLDSLTARPGFLRLIASKPIPSAERESGGKLKGPFWGAPNTLSQRQLGIGQTRVEAKLDLTGLKPGARTGITHFSGSFQKYGGQYAIFGVREEGEVGAGGRASSKAAEEATSAATVAAAGDGEGEAETNTATKRVLFFVTQDGAKTGPEITTDTLYLRSDTDFDQATFAWSPDGETWHETDYHYTLKFGNWRGNRPGLFCWNVKTDKLEDAGYVDVDWFRYEPSAR